MQILHNKKALIGIGVAVCLLLLMTIPGILSGPQKKRDDQRVKDVAAIQTAVETYYRDNDSYPNDQWQTALTDGATPYLTEIPTDPLNGDSYGYVPGPNGCYSTCTSYTISIKMEKMKNKKAPGGVYSVTSKPTSTSR